MKPIGSLMWEHRLIEQIVPLIRKEIDRIENERMSDIAFIETAVDFFRTYADRTHHGKEEDILFRDLMKKTLSADHTRIMRELTAEHMVARTTVRALLEAKSDFMRGNHDALKAIAKLLHDLVNLYPPHIEKEDRQFFFPVMDYFTKAEQDAMMDEFREFDRSMIHEKYRGIIEFLGGKGVKIKLT